jgi:predicted transcriptional regulator
MNERRSDVKIMVEILNISFNGAKKTEIVYKANLNFRQAQKYLNFLAKKGLLAANISTRGRNKYQTTQKGKAFAERYEEIVELVE